MMSLNVKDYAKTYDVFDDAFCKQTIKTLKKSQWILHNYFDYATGSYKTYEDDLDVTYGKINEQFPWEVEEIHKRIWYTIHKYICEDHAHISWFQEWHGYTRARFNRYKKNTRMRPHCDHIQSIFDGTNKGVPILTILGSLNNDYEGGELIMWENDVVELKAGQIMIFPSNFLYPHEIKPVTKGIRHSFVSWVW